MSSICNHSLPHLLLLLSSPHPLFPPLFSNLISSPLIPSPLLLHSNFLHPNATTERILDPTIRPPDRVSAIVRALDLCENSITSAVGCVDDVAQCMGLTHFRAEEGTINRYALHCTCFSYSVMSCYIILCFVMLRYVMSCHVMSCHVMSCHVMSCHVMLCYVTSCYVMLLPILFLYIQYMFRIATTHCTIFMHDVTPHYLPHHNTNYHILNFSSQTYVRT